MLLIIAGALALIGFLKCLDENYRKRPLTIAVLPAIIIFIISAISIRHGWLDFSIDINQPGQIDMWMLAMVGIQTGLIIIFKYTLRPIMHESSFSRLDSVSELSPPWKSRKLDS